MATVSEEDKARARALWERFFGLDDEADLIAAEFARIREEEREPIDALATEWERRAEDLLLEEPHTADTYSKCAKALRAVAIRSREEGGGDAD